MTNLTSEILRERLRYDPETGIFTRLLRTSGRVKIGDCAGWRLGKGYVSFNVGGRPYLAHRLAWLYMTSEWPAADIDHINMDRADNRWCNLREATRTQNLANTAARLTNRAGLKGVHWSQHANKWRAMIQANGTRRHLGYFNTPGDAHASYRGAADAVFGEFARS